MNFRTGAPCWVDLNSNTFDESKAFFEQLLGWEFEDQGEQFAHYNIVRAQGSLVGGAMDTSEMVCPDDGTTPPPSFDIYLSVDDIQSRFGKAVEAGARPLVEPQHVRSLGWMAMVAAPDEAAVSMWQPEDLAGFDFTMKHGTPVWFELLSQDFDAVEGFYRDVFEFDFQAMPDSEQDGKFYYFTNGAGDDTVCGVCDAKGFIPAEMGSFWRVYFAVDNCDEAAAKVTELGGTVHDGPEDSPHGRVATVSDPAGARFQIIQSPAQ